MPAAPAHEPVQGFDPVPPNEYPGQRQPNPPPRNQPGPQIAPPINPLMAINALQRGMGYVPDKGELGAPKTFKGDANKLDDFLEKVNRIIAACSIEQDADKVRVLFGYLGGDAKAFVREQPSYKEPNFASLVQALREAYPSPKHQFRYTTRDLERVASKYHKKNLKYLEDLADYQRRFAKVGLWLLNKNRIEDERYNRLFWDGLPTEWQQFLKNNGDKHGLVVDPSETPKADQVLQALRKALSYENFDADLLYRKRGKKSSHKSRRRSKHRSSFSSDDSDSDSDSDESSSDSDSDSSSDTDSDSEKDRKKRRSKEHKDKSSASSTTPQVGSLERMIESVMNKNAFRQHEHVANAAQAESSIDDLVRRMNGLNAGTSEYLVIWAELARRAPHVASAVAVPAQTPFVSANAVQSGRPRAANFDSRCYGCGEPGHLMRDCEAVNAYVVEGILHRTADGRIRMTNGVLPSYSADRPLVKVLREQGTIPRAIPHKVPAGNGQYVHDARFIEVETSEDEAFEVNGAQRKRQDARVTDGPATRTRAAQQHAADPATAKATPGLIPIAKFREAQAEAEGQDQVSPPVALPEGPKQDDPKTPAQVVGAPTAPTPAELEKRVHKYALISGTDKEFGSKTTAQKLLDQHVSVPMGALLSQPGIQKAIFPLVQRHRHFETGKIEMDEEEEKSVEVSRVEDHLSGAPLSCKVGKAPVIINNMVLTAVLDSGSEINIMSRDTTELLGLPLTKHNGIMRTADGHTSPMYHIVRDVKVELGGIVAVVHFYVVEGHRTQLLLGRPWQRQVRFEHRDKENGLVITINDPIKDIQYSFLATPTEKSHPVSAYSRARCDPEIEEDGSGEEKDELSRLVAGVYKPVSRKVRPVATGITEDDRIKLNIPADFDADLPPLPFDIPDFAPGKRLTTERLSKMDLDPDELLNEEERKLLLWILRTNERALAFDESEKGVVDPNIVPPIRIPVVEHEVWDHKNFKLPPAVRDQINALVRAKVNSGLYEPSSAAYTSRWFPVAKKTPGQYRIVHDLQPLNAIAVRNPGRLPPIDEFVGSVSGRACIGTLDMFSGFDQIWLAIECRDLTTFETEDGRFRHTRLPQGGTNSCIVFHFVVVAIVGPTGKVYVDDVVVPGPTSRYNEETIPENPSIRRFAFEYLGNLHRVLHRIGKSGMTVSGHKMAPIRRSVSVLGQEVSDQGRRVAQDKVDAIQQWGPCNSVTEVRSFLGIAGQARSWIPDYSVVVKPLTQLVRKDTPFEWGLEQQEAMDRIKDLVVKRAYLVELKYGPDMEPIQLGVDAGPLACGFWLGQKDEHGVIQVARYGSLPFNEREQRYSQPKRELYAVFRALKHFAHWLYAAKVIVRTDASFVKGMIAHPELPSSAMTRWLAYIMLFDIEVIHVPARNNALADGLSRRPAQPEDPTVIDDDVWLEDKFKDFDEVSSLPESEQHEVNRVVGLDQELDQDGNAKPILQVLSMTGAANEDNEQNPQRLSLEHQQIFDFLNSGEKPSAANNYQKNRNFLRKVNRYFVAGQALWRKGGVEETGRLVVDDESERMRVIKELHDETGHKGVGTTIHALEKRFYWSGLGNTVKEWIRTCDACQKRERGIVESAVRPTLPPHLFQRFGLDITYLPNTGGYRYLVVARDDLSGWVVARALKKKTARAVARFLIEEIFTRHGLPLLITTDQGTEFKGIVSVLLQKYKIDIARTSAFNPRANGAVERGHKSLKDSIVHAARSLDVPWHQVVHLACWMDRTMVRRQYGHSPFFLVYGHEPILPVDLSTPDLLARYAQVPDDGDALLLAIKDRITRLGSHQELLDLAQKRKAEDRQRSAARRNLQDMLGNPSYAPGQLVLVRNFHLLNTHAAESKTEDRWFGPLVVITQSIQGGVWLKTSTGTVLPSPIHPSHVKAYRPRIRPVFAHVGAEEP